MADRPTVELVLYVGDGCERSERAIELLVEVLGEYEPDDVVCQVHNVIDVPPAQLADDCVLVTPTLLLRRPLRLWLVGELRETGLLRTLLSTAGVTRRRP